MHDDQLERFLEARAAKALRLQQLVRREASRRHRARCCKCASRWWQVDALTSLHGVRVNTQKAVSQREAVIISPATMQHQVSKELAPGCARRHVVLFKE